MNELISTDENGWIEPKLEVTLGTTEVVITSDRAPQGLTISVSTARLEPLSSLALSIPAGSESFLRFRLSGDLPLSQLSEFPFEVQSVHESQPNVPTTLSQLDGFGIVRFWTPSGTTHVRVASPLFPGQHLDFAVEGEVFSAQDLVFDNEDHSIGITRWITQNEWTTFSVLSRDVNGSPQPGVSVEFNVAGGDVQFGPKQVYSDANGVARISVMPREAGILSFSATSAGSNSATKSVAVRPITYEQDVQMALQKCVACHDSTHGLPFENYRQIRHGVSPWSKKPVINTFNPELSPLVYLTEPPFGSMFQNAAWVNPENPFTPEEATLLRGWVESGALETFEIPDAPAQIVTTSTEGQIGVPLSRLPNPLSFKVTDSLGRPTPLVPMVFHSNIVADIISGDSFTDFEGATEMRIELSSESADRVITVSIPGTNIFNTFKVSVNSNYKAGFMGLSNQLIDRALSGVLRSHNIEATERSSKPEFLRRIVADTTGRHPGMEDSEIGNVIETYLLSESDSEADRRQLINGLLESSLFLKHWIGERIALWIEMPTEADPRHGSPKFDEPILELLKKDDSLANLVKTLGLLGGKGKDWDSIPFSEAGYAITSTHDVMEYGKNSLDMMLGAFGGVSIACARCHDHKLTGPLDDTRWTQSQAFDVYAFSILQPAGLDMLKVDGSRERHHVEFPVWWGDGDGEPFESSLSLENNQVSWTAIQIAHRQELWGRVVESPLFPRAVSHRLWAELFNPLVNPVDIRNETLQPLHRNGLIDLMAALEVQFIEDGMGLKKFLRSLFNSHAYQLSSSASDQYDSKGDIYFARFPVRRHFAEVIDHGFYAISQFPFVGHAYLPLKLLGYPERRIVPFWDHRRSPAGVTEALMIMNSSKAIDWKAKHQLSKIQSEFGEQLVQARFPGDKRSIFTESARDLVFNALLREPTVEEMSAIDSLEPTKESLIDLAVALGLSSEFLFR